jgi:hypothetical protein
MRITENFGNALLGQTQTRFWDKCAPGTNALLGQTRSWDKRASGRDRIEAIPSSMSPLLLTCGLLLLGLRLPPSACSAHTVWDCERAWPGLELFLPVSLRGSRMDEWKELFLRTFLLHWPIEVSKTKLLIVLDEEQRDSTEVKDAKHYITQFPKLAPQTRFAFNNPNPDDYNNQGHNRQQLLMFYADNFTSSEFVGFVDTDTFFVTYVDREDLFEDDKPVVNGKIGNPHKKGNLDPLWQDITATTFDLLGMLEPMKCMAYFPVIVRTNHLMELRKYLEDRYQLPFIEIYRKHIVTRRYSQFNIFCTYLFHKHRDSYRWYSHDLSPEWDFINPPPIYGQLNDSKAYNDEMRYPKPLIATHARYHSPNIIGRGHANMRATIMQAGICVSPPFPKPIINVTSSSIQHFYENCRWYSTEEDYKQEIYDEMFKFEWSNYLLSSPLSQVQSASYSRMQRIRHCKHSYHSEDLMEVMSIKPQLSNGDVIYTPETGMEYMEMHKGIDSSW